MTSLANVSDSKRSKHALPYVTDFATKVWMPNWATSTASEASRTRSKIFKKTPVTNHEKINAAMISKLLIASCLVATTVMIHAVGLGMTLSHVLRSTVRPDRSEEHTSELQSHSDLVCRLLLEKKKKNNIHSYTVIH